MYIRIQTQGKHVQKYVEVILLFFKNKIKKNFKPGKV